MTGCGNVPLFKVIVWLNAASAEKDQHLLLHRCLFSPAHQFVHMVGKWQERQTQRSTQKPNDKLYLMNFIFKEVPDRVSKNSVLWTLQFSADSFTNKAQFDTGFSERFKQDNAVPTIMDLTVMSHHTSVSNCLLCGHYCFVCYYRSFDMSIYVFLT